MGFLSNMAGGGLLMEMMGFIVPLWVAVLVGLLLGWIWRPKWAKLVVVGGNGDDGREGKRSAVAAAESQFSFGFSSIPSFDSLKSQCQSCLSWISEDNKSKSNQISSASASSSQLVEIDESVVNSSDFEHLRQLVEQRDGGPAWIPMMDRQTSTMAYQAWRRDPETGPPQYRSRTVYEDATADMVREFFWDDEFRAKWDDMLVQATTLETCRRTGTMIVHWVRKFPFFCSDREYTIGRRIWDSSGAYYCVTKGVPYPSLPRNSKPRRVDLYYSSWCIRAVESRKGDGLMTAVEVVLFHHEDMGIPWEIAKLGVRQGMWGAVKKIEPGFRTYQTSRRSGEPLTECAVMAQINTKVDEDYLRATEVVDSLDTDRETSKKRSGPNIPKLLVVGGAVALACTLDRGLLTKAVIFGVARRFAKIGGRRSL